jgi:ferredoxin-NADP reductase/nitrite reductase/ring-hydroxylating ferredoxin subunit
MLNAPFDLWFPIASSSDLAPRHVFHAQLFGQEYTAWRADDGYVNLWENRCLHRGVRLSIGINDGAELKCQYHGWRYANRTAGCTYIPAHPADAPARTICNNKFPVAEAHGMIWTRPDGRTDAPPPLLSEPLSDDAIVLRPLPVNAPSELAAEVLLTYRFHPEGDNSSAAVTASRVAPFTVSLTSEGGGHTARLTLFVQPVDLGRTIIRGWLSGVTTPAVPLLQAQDAGLQVLRDRCEALARALPRPEAAAPVYPPVPAELADLPATARSGGAAALRVTVARKWPVAEGVMAFELHPLRGILPTSQPGAHIDVTLPNGLVRQYSLVNAPGETAHWVIGVKRQTPSGGGSACLHDVVREGDVLAVSAPRNNFPLRQDAAMTTFISGGIGLTPLLAMAQTLHYRGLPFALHAFAASPAHLAFADRIAALRPHSRTHFGRTPDETATDLNDLLAGYAPGRHVYICGPGPMLETARRIAADLGWPDTAVHFEYFKNATPLDLSSTFEISLARSALTLTVPPGRSILDVLRDNGVEVPSSCGQGACGTCAVALLEGEALHQDVYLNAGDRRASHTILTCVSRAVSPCLVLDV